MTTSRIPALIDAMLADFPTLVGLGSVTVCDGLPLTNETGTYLYVGVDDPDGLRVAAADAEQSWPHAVAQGRDEEGGVTLACESIDGGGDLKACRDEVFRVVGLVQDRLRASKTLDVPGVLWLNATQLRFEQAQTSVGAAALLTFRVNYQARI